jgi:tetratricopeptide (TPR) repeat protein
MEDKKQQLLNVAQAALNNKDVPKAIECLIKIVQQKQADAPILCHLARLFVQQKQFQNAVNAYQEAIKYDASFVQTYHEFGNLLKNLKKYDEALKVFVMGVRQHPKDFHLHNQIGMVYELLFQNNRAIEAYKNAVRINPKFAKAVNNIAVVLYKQQRYNESAKMFELALQIDPNYVEVYSNLGAALNKSKQYEKAIKMLEIAIAKLPKSGGAYTNLGNVYNKLHEYKKAQKLHEKSIELDPKGSNAYANLGCALKNQGLMKQAIQRYEQAIALDADFVNAHFDLSTALLTIGEFEQGFKEYEWRFKKEEMHSHIIKYKEIFSKPMLTFTTNANNKTVLVHSEQGFGDSLMFVRFIPQLKKKFGCRVVFKARDELVELFKNNCSIDEVVYRSETTPEFDFHLPVMSLAYVLNVKSKEEFLQTPYLDGNKSYEALQLPKNKKPKIGLCWSASITGESYEGKVFELNAFDKLLASNKFDIYSLQVGKGSEQIQQYGYEQNIIDKTELLDNFDKTAFLAKQLDLIITSDTSVAHLCGALGIKTWVLLQKYPDWRWENKGAISYMYCNATLIRQKTNRVWDSVFQSVFDRIQKEFKLKL